MKTLSYFFLLLALLGASCSSTSEESTSVAQTALTDPPEWAKHVIWYQIFPERFRNGDPNNDPSPADLEGSYPGFVPEGWAPTPWTQDWYAPDPYFDEILGQVDMAGDSIRRFDRASRLRRSIPMPIWWGKSGGKNGPMTSWTQRHLSKEIFLTR